MKKFLLSLACVLMTVVSSLAATVYFENTADWASVYAYAWSPNNAGWPGLQVTSTITVSGRTFYEYELPGAQANIIFNNGGNGAQTKDLKVEDGVVYSGANASSIDALGHIVDGAFVAAGEVVVEYATIYVSVETWSKAKCFIYSWSPSLFGDWPGSEMTKVNVSGQDYWSIKIDKREIEGVTVAGWKLNAGLNQAESVNNEKGTVFEDGKVYNLTSGTGSELGAVVVPTDPYADNNLAVHGQIFGDSNWSSTPLERVEEGVYELTAKIVPGNFGIKVCNEDGNQVDWIGGEVEVTEADKVYSFNYGNNSSTTLEGNYTITYNSMENTIKFTPYGGEIEEVVTYAVKGTICGTDDWIIYEMTENEGKWEITLDIVEGDFGIAQLTNGAQSNWFSAPNGENAMDEAGTYATTNFAGANWHSTLTGKYTFIFDPEADTLKVELFTGVDAITVAEEGAAVYYNLQGVRVANPVNGLYIRVAGGKAVKVVL